MIIPEQWLRAWVRPQVTTDAESQTDHDWPEVDSIKGAAGRSRALSLRKSLRRSNILMPTSCGSV